MMEVHAICAISLTIGCIAALWMIRVGRPAAVEAAPSPEMLEAMREVDALTPGSAPLAPCPIEAVLKFSRRDPNWLPPGGRPPPPPAPPPKVYVTTWPRCTGAGGCGYHHRKGIPCGQALNERRPPPPPPHPMPTRAPGPGTLAQS